MRKNLVRTVDNDLSGDKILGRIEIGKTDERDLMAIGRVVAKAFQLPSENHAVIEMMNANVLLEESVKLYDRTTGDIYGVLIFCEDNISYSTGLEFHDENLSRYLEGFKQVNGYAFVIDSRLRNHGLDNKMLKYNLSYFVKNYDFIWCGVEHGLNTDRYWERKGFSKVFEGGDASFYMFPFNKKVFT